jgi:hypothetical protein
LLCAGTLVFVGENVFVGDIIWQSATSDGKNKGFVVKINSRQSFNSEV